MIAIDAQTIAIAEAIEAGTIRIEDRFSDRLGEPYCTIEDAAGMIEVTLDRPEAEARIAEVRARAEGSA